MTKTKKKTKPGSDSEGAVQPEAHECHEDGGEGEGDHADSWDVDREGDDGMQRPGNDVIAGEGDLAGISLVQANRQANQGVEHHGTFAHVDEQGTRFGDGALGCGRERTKTLTGWEDSERRRRREEGGHTRELVGPEGGGVKEAGLALGDLLQAD